RARGPEHGRDECTVADRPKSSGWTDPDICNVPITAPAAFDLDDDPSSIPTREFRSTDGARLHVQTSTPADTASSGTSQVSLTIAMRRSTAPSCASHWAWLSWCPSLHSTPTFAFSKVTRMSKFA